MGLASRRVSRACCPLAPPGSSQCQRKPARKWGRAGALRPWSQVHRALPTFPTGLLLQTGPGLSVPPQSHCPRGKAHTLTLGVPGLAAYVVSLQSIFAYSQSSNHTVPISLPQACQALSSLCGAKLVICTPPTFGWLLLC